MRDYEKSQIIKLRAEGNGYGKIARTLGISLNTVKSFCRRNDVRAGMTVDAPVTEYSGVNTTCPNCGTPILQIARQKKKKFCCDKCRNRWWNTHLDRVKRKTVYDIKCACCGREFHIYGDNRRKYCSHDCYIKARFGGKCHE